MSKPIRKGNNLIILIPGLGFTSDIFIKIIPQLKNISDVLTFDFFNSSDPLQNNTNGLNHFTEKLHDMVLAHNDANITLIGWSAGMTIAVNLLSLYSCENISKLIGIEQTPYLLSEDTWPYSVFGKFNLDDANDFLKLIECNYTLFADSLTKVLAPIGEQYDKKHLNHLLLDMNKSSPIVVRNLFNDIIKFDIREKIRQIDIPFIFFRGKKSRVYPMDISKWYMENCQYFHYTEFIKSGHMPFIDEPDKFIFSIDHYIFKKYLKG